MHSGVVQVLRTEPEMSASDIALVACFPAIMEEILFRGAVVGNLGGTTGAVAFVSLLFGYLHVSGPRNYASGIFAAAAGAAYGLVYISSQSVLAAAFAHCVGNATSAASWLFSNPASSDSARSEADDALPEEQEVSQ
jgi:membrane protease YdiL (CAAX protease family)